MINDRFIDRYSFMMPKKIKSLTLSMKEEGDLELRQADNDNCFDYIKVITEERSAREFTDNESMYKARLARSRHEGSRGDS